MEKVATFHSPFKEKFGVPRQAGVVPQVLGRIILEKPFRSPDAIRGMEDFDYLWLIWGFSANKRRGSESKTSVSDGSAVGHHLTVRPPRLGGNKQLGVFATRSPFRPNPLGLSSVKIDHIDYDCPDAPVIYVTGADLMDGTPIYDIKPYIPYTDAHPEARGGFTDTTEWQPLHVTFDEGTASALTTEQKETLTAILAQDPRPHYHDDPNRIYGMAYDDYNVRFKVEGDNVIVVEISK